MLKLVLTRNDTIKSTDLYDIWFDDPINLYKSACGVWYRKDDIRGMYLDSFCLEKFEKHTKGVRLALGEMCVVKSITFEKEGDDNEDADAGS